MGNLLWILWQAEPTHRLINIRHSIQTVIVTGPERMALVSTSGQICYHGARIHTIGTCVSVWARSHIQSNISTWKKKKEVFPQTGVCKCQLRPRQFRAAHVRCLILGYWFCPSVDGCKYARSQLAWQKKRWGKRERERGLRDQRWLQCAHAMKKITSFRAGQSW